MTRHGLKERLKAKGLWESFLRIRDQLRREGRTPAEARAEAIRQVEAQAADRTQPAEADSEAEFERPPLCDRCEQFGRPRCDYCLLDQWLYYERVEMKESEALCFWCWRDDQLGTPPEERVCAN